MSEGDNVFMGRGVPINGNFEITGESTTEDIMTITHATSGTGDFIVCQNSTGAELFVLTSSGAITSAGGKLNMVMSSSGVNGIQVAITSTGAIAAGATLLNAFHVQASSKSVLNSIVGYNSGGGSEVSTCDYFFAVHGSKAPTYLLGLGATAVNVGAETDNGFLDVGLTMTADPTSASAYAGIKCLFGTKAYYILAVPDSSLS